MKLDLPPPWNGTPPLAAAGPLHAGALQPARRSFGITHIQLGDRARIVASRDVLARPFWTLVELACEPHPPLGNLLLVAPLSGHFAILLRDLVVRLLPWFRVHVIDWTNVRHVPAGEGELGLAGNVGAVIEGALHLGPDLTVAAVCQGGVPALAATSLLAAAGKAVSSLVLIGAPIDPLANPTRVVTLLREHPLAWYEANTIAAVGERYLGAGRAVYPAEMQLAGLSMYLARRMASGGEMARKVMRDDGCDPARAPFLDLFASVMDLDGRFFLDNVEAVYHERRLVSGSLTWNGHAVEPAAIETTRLLTIEGEEDDIAAPGQTWSAHMLCPRLPAGRRGHVIVPRAGHFSLLHGEPCRSAVVPAIVTFLAGGPV